MKYKIDLEIENLPTNFITEEAYSIGFGEIEKLLKKLLKKGIIPRIGERLVPLNDGFEQGVIITYICYCSHKVMINCKFD